MIIVTKLPYILIMITLICAYKRVRIMKKQIQSKIVGGKPAKIRDYPFMIRLEAKYILFTILCGGSYIKPLWVITAAHCLDVNDQATTKPPSVGKKNRIRCIAGLQEKKQKRTYQQLYSVDLFINPTYFRNDTDTENDVGLIQLPEPFLLDNVVQMIEMPTESIDYSGGIVRLLGWGASKATDRPEIGIATWPKNLQVLRTHVQDMKNCLREMGSPSAICVGERGRIACSGDSGGPLVFENMLIGVCSYGFGCGEDTIVYENIYYHMEWIKNVTEYTPPKNVTNPGSGGGWGGSVTNVPCYTILNIPVLLTFSILICF